LEKTKFSRILSLTFEILQAVDKIYALQDPISKSMQIKNLILQINF